MTNLREGLYAQYSDDGSAVVIHLLRTSLTSGKMYARILVQTDDRHGWVRLKSLPSFFDRDRCSYTAAIVLAQIFEFCCVCGNRLRKPEHIAQGMGRGCRYKE